MKEFNYVRAWNEFVKPEFEKIYHSIKTAYDETEKVVNQLSQVGAHHELTGQTPYLTGLYDAIDPETLSWASQVVYNYGYLSPCKTAQAGGLYWKFQILADTSLINRKCHGPDSVMDKAKIKMDQALKAFHDHKEGTEYDRDEIPDYLRSLDPTIEGDVLSIVKVQTVNHKPDVFCISQRHMRGDSIYLDPNVAPCATCGQAYKDHTYDTAMFVKVKVQDKEKLVAALKKIADLCKGHNIKVDGFALIDWKEESNG